MILPRIIAAALALVDEFLAQWVTVSSTTVGNTATCYTGTMYTASVNACGTAFIAGVTDIVEGLVALIPSLLGSLFVVG
jgi:hypothetical protein